LCPLAQTLKPVDLRRRMMHHQSAHRIFKNHTKDL